MHFSNVLASLGLLAGVASAVPNFRQHQHPKRASAGQNVVYWGQDYVNKDPATYCTSAAGVDILILSFLSNFGNGHDIAYGNFGDSCSISSSGAVSNCAGLATSIELCKAAGVKIIVSLGGGGGSFNLASQAEAVTIGTNLWKAFGNVAAGSVPRPFGTTFVNGFDFDIESVSGNQYFQYMISTLRTAFTTDPSNTYYITGAPQCPIPEPNMGTMISSAKFDYLFIQFYNNNPDCSLGFNGGAAFNFNAWVSFVAGTPSAGAKLFIGVPASPTAATDDQSGAVYYATPSQLSTLVSQYKSNAAFGGIMMWSAYYSDNNILNGCNYAQEAHAILASGAPAATCSGTGVATTVTSTTATKTTSTTSVKTTTTSTTTTSAPASTCTACTWTDHCAGATCAADTDCDGSLTCINGTCDGCTWIGHCACAACSTADDCDGALVCTNGVCGA